MGHGVLGYNNHGSTRIKNVDAIKEIASSYGMASIAIEKRERHQKEESQRV
jgi:hypothetical protein